MLFEEVSKLALFSLGVLGDIHDDLTKSLLARKLDKEMNQIEIELEHYFQIVEVWSHTGVDEEVRGFLYKRVQEYLTIRTYWWSIIGSVFSRDHRNSTWKDRIRKIEGQVHTLITLMFRDKRPASATPRAHANEEVKVKQG